MDMEVIESNFYLLKNYVLGETSELSEINIYGLVQR